MFPNKAYNEVSSMTSQQLVLTTSFLKFFDFSFQIIWTVFPGKRKSLEFHDTVYHLISWAASSLPQEPVALVNTVLFVHKFTGLFTRNILLHSFIGSHWLLQNLHSYNSKLFFRNGGVCFVLLKYHHFLT